MDEHRDLTRTRLRLAFFLTIVILAVEALAGWISHSLALLADAGHILSDVVALGLAWFAAVQAQRPADQRRTYGYHRVGILTAMANGVTLVLIVIAVAYEAVRRLAHPEPVQGGLVIGAAAVAIVVNTTIALGLRGHTRNLNVRAAMLHVVGDLAASIGVVFAGGVILLTGWLYADPLVSLGIAALIAFGAVKIVIDTVNILLEGTPKGVDLDEVRSEVLRTPEVKSVHDLHVWTLAPEQLALSAHLVIPEEQDAVTGEHLVRELEQRLCARFGIGHTTVQLEACHPCSTALGHGVGEHNHPHTHGAAASHAHD